MTSIELLKEIDAWLSFNTEPSKEETAKLRKSIKDHLTEQLRIHDVVGGSEQFNCLGGNYAKGIPECKEWCGEDMCRKPSN